MGYNERHCDNLKWKKDPRSYLRNLSSCEKKAWKKNSGLNGIRTHNLCDAGAPIQEHCTGIAEVMCSNPVQAWIFFRLSFRNCLSCVLTARIFLPFNLSSAVQNICFIYLHSFIHPSRVYYELTIWPAASWLDSSVGRALHQHRKGHGFESCSSLNFSRLSFRNCF